MTASDSVKTRLTEVFRHVFDNPALELAETTTAKDVPGWDSLTHVDLIFAVESEFGVKFTTREVMTLANVGELMAAVARKTAK